MTAARSTSAWAISHLEDLCADGRDGLVGGPFGSDLTSSDYQHEPGVPVIRGSNLGGDSGEFVDDGFVFVSEQKAGSLRRNTAVAGDIIFTQRGTLGQVAIIPSDSRFPRYVISQSQMRMTPDTTRIEPRFLFHFFRSPKSLSKISSRALTTGVPHINLRILREFVVEFPALCEQRRIAETLDKANALRAKRSAAIAQLDTLTQAIFLDMFGDPVANPRKWPTAPIGELAEIGTGSTPDRTNENNFGGYIPWVKTTEVNWNDIADTDEKLTDHGLRSSRCKLYPRGSIVVALYGQGPTRGRAAILAIEAATNQACGVIKPNGTYDCRFLFQHLKFSYRKLRELSRGGNQANLNMALLSRFIVLVPPLQRQLEFRERFDVVNNAKVLNQESLAKLDALFASLQHRAFRGEL
jgi:type I restriction enzyme S subunit